MNAETAAVGMAKKFLAKALDRAQAAVARGAAAEIRLPLTASQCPDFFTLRNLDAAEAFRSELALAERAGAIRLARKPRAVEPNDVAAILVVDLPALAERLHVELRTDLVGQARERLANTTMQYPVLDEVLKRWADGKLVRGFGPTEEAIRGLLDAIAIRAARAGQADEVMLRRESARLFGDSKRVEQLSAWLDLLGEGGLISSGLSRSDIFSALGLRKEPQPFLIAGEVRAGDGRTDIPLFRPYHGLPMESIQAFRFGTRPACVLTVENKASFHELANLAGGAGAGVIYSAGMPSPAWCRVYRLVLEALPTGVPIYHFGDLDVGGFRIARVVANVVRDAGMQLLPWLMDPAYLLHQGHHLKPASESQVQQMARYCNQIGWGDLADSIVKNPGLLEQEHVAPCFPNTKP